MARHSPAYLLVHVVWATSHRWPMLPEAFDDLLLAILGRKARDAGCHLLGGGCASDHVHALLRLSPTVALANAVQRLKGATAHDVNQRALLSEHLGWQAGYWAESFGPADAQQLLRYVRVQRFRHDDSHPAERWQLGVDRESANGGL